MRKNLAFILLALLISCKTQTPPTESEVMTAVQQYLDTKTTPNTVMIGVGTVDFSSKNAKLLLPKYQKLAKEGYLSFGHKAASKGTKDEFLQGTFIDENPNKSKSMMQVSVLTPSDTFVVRKNGGKYLLKSSEWSTKSAKITAVEARAEHKYKATVELHLETTPFSILENIDTNSITKLYLLKLTANHNWEVEGELKK